MRLATGPVPRVGLVLSLLFASALAERAAAQTAPQDYPARTVTVVAPSAPGGMYSLFARLIATKLEQKLGKTFIVENRPGASSTVGITSVVRAPSDGHTLIVVNNTGLAVNPALRRDLAYDSVKDIAPIALIVHIPEVLVVNSAVPVTSISDLVALAKSKPGGLTYGSAGPGTAQHLGAVVLQNVLGIQMTHVPYKGMSPAINDVAAGHIPLMFSPVPFAIPLSQAGKLRMIAVTTPQRVPAIPDVPTLREAGVTAFGAVSWFMLAAHGNTPKPIVDLLHREMKAITADPQVRDEFSKLGLLPIAASPDPDALREMVKSEIARWAEVVSKAGLAPKP